MRAGSRRRLRSAESRNRARAVRQPSAPLFQNLRGKWADAYKKETGNGLNYQSIGSGGGIKADHGQAGDLRCLRHAAEGRGAREVGGFVQFPTVLAASCRFINIEASSRVGHLDGLPLAKIFLARDQDLERSRHRQAHPWPRLPAQPSWSSTVSDRSGTSFHIWTTNLSKVSADWKSKVGATPRSSGRRPRAKGNEGVGQHMSARPKARSATWNMHMPSRTSLTRTPS